MTDRTRRCFLSGAAGLACAAIVALSSATAPAAEEEGDFELHEVSLWGFDPTLEQANQLQHYPSLMPGVVDTERSRAGAESQLTPFSLMTFHGPAVKNLEIDLRVQAGRFTAHWPPGESKNGRLRWLDVALSAEPGQDARLAAVDAKHWFNAARRLDALYLSLGARIERVILYDAEFKFDQPLQISGGPDRYQLANLSKSPIYDVLVVAPAAEGRRRIGRAEMLPVRSASAKQPTESPPGEKRPGDQKPGDKQPDKKPDEQQPAAGKPENDKPADVNGEDKKAAAEQAAAAEVAKAAAAELAKAAAAVNAPPLAVAPAAPGQPAAQPPAAQAPAAQPPAAVLAGEPVEIEISAPLAEDSAELVSARQSLADSLQKQGLSAAEVELFMDRAAPAIFKAKELIVVCRLSAEAIEERLPLATYPAARKTVRTALLVLRNVDPKLKDDVNRLLANLGAADYADREAAEKRLLELGRLAVPALKAALKSPDAEVQFRAERLLLTQNEKVDGT